MQGLGQLPVGRSVRVAVPATSANLGPGFEPRGLDPAFDLVAGRALERFAAARVAGLGDARVGLLAGEPELAAKPLDLGGLARAGG